jgi:hypothetical protein
MRQRTAYRSGPDAREQLQHAETGDRVSWVLNPAQDTEHVLDMCCLKELQPAILHERDTAAPEFNLELIAVVAGTEQYALSFQGNACLAVL